MFDTDRRGFVKAAGGLLGGLVVPAAWRGTAAASPSRRSPLWSGEAPGGCGPSGPIVIDPKGAVSNVARPTLEVFQPARPNGAAVLIAAGGGYKRIEMATEAMPAVRWLIAQGITAYVLTYRLPDEGWHDGPLAPLQDAQRAIRMIRAETNGPVGVLGRIDIHRSQIMAAARWTKPVKWMMRRS